MIKIPTLQGESSEKKRQEIKIYFQYCYKRYESLFNMIADEKAYFQKADPLRHPIIFYYGHTATFFINKLKLAKIIDERIDPRLESIFAVGVDEMSWDDLDVKHYVWPILEETQIYRDKVYTLVTELIDTLPLELPLTWKSPWWVILMGIEHENIHLETSSVLIRQLPFASVKEDSAWQECAIYGEAPQNELLDVSAGTVILGKNQDSKLFGWDNEYGIHQAEIPAFKASKYLVSNGEYLEFIQEGGYADNTYWCSEGKAWKEFTNPLHPLFWSKRGTEYILRTVSREILLPLNWPVEVNCLEAEAFCRWKSQKEGKHIVLPTEDEYIRLRDATNVSNYVFWMQKGKTFANIALDGYASPVPVNTYKHGAFYDVVGNIWQWSRTPIYPFEGFKVHPVYDDFTVPTFDGKHNLINGGSWISCGNLATQKSRYGFRKHFYQHAGFRYVESNYEEKIMNFEAIDRRGTYSTKLDDAVKKFGTDDLLPLWVADMDLASPECVQDAMQRRAAHPLYGYTVYPQRYFDAISEWIKKRFDWEIKQEWIVPCYGVVPSMNFAIEAYSKKGDGIVIQSPIYPPFSSSVKRRKRKLYDNVLIYKNGRYEIDFKDFENKIKKSKMFLLCSPHNPTGRVWSEAELEKMINICLAHNVVIVSDEIHADIVYEKIHHIIGRFEKMKDHCVILNAPSKTFNVAGLNTSYAIIPDNKLRRRFSVKQDRSGVTNGNPFGIEALIAAYEEGDAWLEALKKYLLENIAFIQNFIVQHHLPIKIIPVEATFLVWLDCSNMGLSHDDLIDFFIHHAKLGLNDGRSFGKAGEGFMRLNIGTSREVLEVAMQRLLLAYKDKN